MPPGPAARHQAAELGKLKPRLQRAYRQAILEDRWMPKGAYFNDGRYQGRVADPWYEKIDRAINQAQNG